MWKIFGERINQFTFHVFQAIFIRMQWCTCLRTIEGANFKGPRGFENSNVFIRQISNLWPQNWANECTNRDIFCDNEIIWDRVEEADGTEDRVSEVSWATCLPRRTPSIHVSAFGVKTVEALVVNRTGHSDSPSFFVIWRILWRITSLSRWCELLALCGFSQCRHTYLPSAVFLNLVDERWRIENWELIRNR